MGDVKLWIGRAGTGKSRRVAEEIAEEVRRNPLGGKIFWIVPETVSFAAERRLVEAVGSTVRAEVLSLPRLALRVQAMMQTLPGNPVNQTGQRLLLAQVLNESAAKLTLLHRAKPTLSFLDSILEAFEEMSEHRVSMQQLESTLQIASTRVDAMDHPHDAHTGRTLLGKLGDLCTLYFLYQKALAKRKLYDPSELMERVHGDLARCTMFDGATLYIDGFRDMQPRELYFAFGLAQAADHTTLVISGDPSWFAPQPGANTRAPSRNSQSLHLEMADLPLFQAVDEVTLTNGVPLADEMTLADLPHITGSPDLPTLTELLEATRFPGDVYAPESLRLYREWMTHCAGAQLRVDVVPFLRLENGQAGMLEYLEQNLISETRSMEPFADDAKGEPGPRTGLVRLAAAQNIRAEAEGIARDILSQVYDGGYAFEEVMVVVPGLTDYTPLLREVLTRYEIPFDMADPPALSTHPLAKFILASLAVVDEGLSTSAVLRVLKTDFCAVDRDDADWLEGYLVRHQIMGLHDWQSDWRYAEKASDRADDPRARAEDNRANRLRQQLAAYLIPFLHQLMKPECTPLQVAEAIWGLLEAVRAKRRLAAWLVDEGNTEDPHSASVHEQAWQRLLGVLNDLCETLPDTPFRRGFLFESIRTDIGSQSLSAVPAGLASVLVTDVERASALHLPVVYVLGLSDGTLPRRIHSTGLLQDEERTQFRVLFGQRLGDTGAERQLAEQWRVYMALTRATAMLTLSYPMAGADGKELRPSSLIGRVQSLFRSDDLPSLWLAEGVVDDVLHAVWTPATALQWLVSVLRDVRHGMPLPKGTSAMYRWLAMHSDYAGKLHSALRGAFHRAVAKPLTKAETLALFGSPLKVNVYQLETFASCPYRHFLQYGLRLSEPAERDATRAERGTLIHAALAEFVMYWREQPEEWRQMDDATARLEMERVFTRLQDEPQFAVWSRSHIRRQQAQEALQVAERAAVSLTRHARYSKFLPTHLEVAFGTSEPGAYGAYEFSLSDGTPVQVRGRVDRIDAAVEEGAHRFRVIDYKSRAMDIDLGKVYHGLRLQLAVYAAVVKAISDQLFGQASEAGGFFYLPLVRKLETENQPEEAAKAFEKALTRMRARGLWRDDGISLGWMDHRLPQAVDSELFPKMFKKDGTITKQAPVLGDTDWNAMESFVLQKVRELAAGIRQGNVDIAPYALDRQDIACRTCSFASVCQFDSRWDHSPLRPLEKMKKETVLAKWNEVQNGGDA